VAVLALDLAFVPMDVGGLLLSHVLCFLSVVVDR
jgi:hypothetical protein